MNKNLLHLKIITPRKVIYEADVLAISSSNSSGKFDILANHANFIGLIEQVPIIVRAANNRNLTFQFPIAVIYVKENLATIFTELQI